MAKHKCNCPPPAPVWLTSWSDLTTLLLTFFVLLVSMASFDTVKFAEVLGSVNSTLGVGANIPTKLDPSSTEAFFVQIVRASSLRKKTPDGGYQQSLAGEEITVTSHRDSYIVKFSETQFFERFKVQLTPEGKRRLAALAQKLKDSVNVVYVTGRVSADENATQFEAVLQTVQLADGTAVRVLATPMETFTPQSGGAGLKESAMVLIQSRDELAAKRAEVVAGFLEASGVSRRRLREIAGDERRLPAEEMFERSNDAGNFVFTYGGPDSGRTVEIVVTGEVVMDR